MISTLAFTAAVIGLIGSAEAATPDSTRIDALSGIEMVWIPEGCFVMGAQATGAEAAMAWHRDQPPYADELPAHEVCLDGHYMARHEVTRAQWARVMGEAEPADEGQGRLPKAEVSWYEARDFASRLSEQTGLRYRLPTEAEWEQACLGGQPAAPYDPDDPEAQARLVGCAWYPTTVEGPSRAQIVGTKAPNGWGLHDTLGNVWEWTADAYDAGAYAQHALHNPSIDVGGINRVIRGGSYRSSHPSLRCGQRGNSPAGERLPTIGFRLVLENPGATKAK